MAEREGNIDTKEGFLFALSAYILWGFLPFYMKAVSHISYLEVTAHRVVWSLPVAGLLLLWFKRTDDIKRAFREPKTLAQAALTAAIISINWGVYVWAIANDRTVETALGYYINPLFSILLAAILLGEKLNPLQILAIICAAIAVTILTIESGGVPCSSAIWHNPMMLPETATLPRPSQKSCVVDPKSIVVGSKSRSLGNTSRPSPGIALKKSYTSLLLVAGSYS